MRTSERALQKKKKNKKIYKTREKQDYARRYARLLQNGQRIIDEAADRAREEERQRRVQLHHRPVQHDDGEYSRAQR